MGQEIKIPTKDGEVNLYDLTGSHTAIPRIYYVNGINTTGQTHAQTAAILSVLLERPVWGVYNKTSGMLRDLGQCLLDYTQNAFARLSSSNNRNKSVNLTDDQIPAFLNRIEREYTVWNRATLELFKELVRHKNQRQLIIAHSQGNLITSNALFVIEDEFGWAGLQHIRVYSLASPSPAWPVGLRITNGGGGRQDNAFMNDLVVLLRPHNLLAQPWGFALAARAVGVVPATVAASTLRQNEGDFRRMQGAGPVSLKPHEIPNIVSTLNFLKSIRRDLGLSVDFDNQQFWDRSREIAKQAFKRNGLEWKD